MAIPEFLRESGTSGPLTVLPGFASAIEGTPFAFKSFHPLAEKGLILRAETGANFVTWKTAALRFDVGSRTACFVLIAGCANGSSSRDRCFTLRVNGQPWFQFRVHSRVESAGWSIPGPGGSLLEFETRWRDWAGDEYGYMALRVPAGFLPEGRPVTLRLEGEEGDSRDWFYIFTYPFIEWADAVSQPALVRGPTGVRQLIGVYVDHVGEPSPVWIRAGSGEELHDAAEFGYNVYALEIAPVHSDTNVQVTVTIGGKTFLETSVTLKPVTRRIFYLLPHSHNDIGYSDHQEAMLVKQFRNIEDALDIIDRTDDYPPEARFKWNVEILWTVEQWLAAASARQRERFESAVRRRRMGLDALYGNMLTGLSRPEEHLRMVRYARLLGRELSFPITSAMSGDIPGFAWGIVPALVQSGVRYFSSGPNYQPFLPDTGDRVGHSNRAWSDRPFYWVSPSGKEKMLFWMAGKGYSWFHEWILGRARMGLAHYFYGYLRELEESAYPYEIVQLRYTVGADNGPTDPDLSDFVREWNERHITPRFFIATTAEMFDDFERRYGASLPVYSGELTPYWEDGALSSLRELGVTRCASQRLLQAETLSALTGPTGEDRRAMDEAWRHITLFHEHTWGAYNSITDPDSDFVRSQWEVKRSFATEAEERSHALLQSAASRRSGDVVPGAVDVVNTTSWVRTGVVVLQADQAGGFPGLRDESGAAAMTQRLSTGEVAFLAENVPPLGMKRFYSDVTQPAVRGNARADGKTLGNGLVMVEVDTVSGAIGRFRDLKRDVELVDRGGGMELNEFLYVPGLDPSAVIRAGRPSIAVLESGPLVVALEIRSGAPGCVEFRRRIQIVHGSPRVDIENTLVRTRVRTKEAIHFAFPFNIPGGEVLLDGGWGVVRPGTDQLSGACKDFLYAQRWVDIANDEFGCTLATVESPIIEIGSMTSEARKNNGVRLWRAEIERSTTIFSYVMNNYWHTNYKADQEGEAIVRYALMPHGKRDLASCARFGIEVQQPLLVFPAVGSARRSMFSLMTSGTPTQASRGVIVPWIDSSQDGKALMIRLLNTGGKAERIRIRWGEFLPARVWESSPFEEEGKPVGEEIDLDVWEFKTLRCAIH